MAIGRAASGGALAPKPATRHRRRTRVFTVFWGGFTIFWDLTSRSTFCSDQAPFPAFLRSDVSSIWDRTMKQWNLDLKMRRCPISKTLEKGGKKGGKGGGRTAYNPQELWSDSCGARRLWGYSPSTYRAPSHKISDGLLKRRDPPNAHCGPSAHCEPNRSSRASTNIMYQHSVSGLACILRLTNPHNQSF